VGGRFVAGEWTTKKDWEKETGGQFKRQESQFRNRIDPQGLYAPEVDRYHLYVSYACPWAHRTLMVRALMGLDQVISFSAVHPLMTDNGWHFDPTDSRFPTPDHLYGHDFLRELYLKADPHCTGRVTVPVLWDKKTESLVSNESKEIIRDMAIHFASLGTLDADLYPEALRPTIDEAMDHFYEPINNGVYRCGFAGNQEAYEASQEELFGALDHWDAVLREQTYVAGEQLTLADLALYATLVRFDPVYYVHFKTCKKHIYEYPGLWRFVCDLIHHPRLRPTLHMDHIKDHYFRSHPQLNPRGFVPPGPELNYS